MTRIARLPLDSHIISGFGAARNGQPLTYNRAPAPDLAGCIARLWVAKIDLPETLSISCGTFSDTPAIRIQLAGSWEHQGAGVVQRAGSAVICGPQARRMPVRVSGNHVSVGIAIRPSACAALLGSGINASVPDRIVPAPAALEQYIVSALPANAAPETWLQALESMIRTRLSLVAGAEPDPITAQFEEIAFRDPGMAIAQAAREIGVDRRRLERLVVRDFGMPPKQVLKRARALDMASHLRGVADAEEGEALALRYYDESHLIREFIELFGLSPRQFAQQSQPLLTMALEARQARRLEMLGRLAPGAKRPWQ